MFQEILKSERTKRGLTPEKLGSKAGCSGYLITQYENYHREPTLEIADALLRALGVSMTIGKEGEK